MIVDMDNISKINFEAPKPAVSDTQTPNPNQYSTSKASLKEKFKKLIKNRKFQVSLVIVVLVIVLSALAVVIPTLKTYQAVKVTYAQAKVTADAIKKQNIELASIELAKTKDDLVVVQQNLHSMGYLKFVPIASWYYNDADHLVNAGFEGLDAATILIDSIKPYADLLGLKGQGSFVGGTAQQRIETAVKAMSKITPKIDEIADKLSLVRKEIDQVEPSHYPAIGPGKKIRSGLENLRTLTDQSVTLIDNSRPLIKILPVLLGEPDDKKYLIIFQNDKELRPTGGFITAYSVFRLDSGVVHVETSSDIYNLDNTISGKAKAPAPILDYLDNVNVLNLRDSNLSPDFKVSMDEFRKLYEKAGAYTKVDGIIAVDTQALVAAMEILGDIDAGGIKFTTKNDPRCDCPQVIYRLEDYADRPVQGTRENRKDIIGQLMYAIMQKAFSSSPKLYWGPLFQAMLTQISEKHILFNMYNNQAQAGLEGLNAAGRIMAFDGDYLHINEANFGGAKSNMFVSENVSQDYNVSSDGTITKTITVSYKNPFPPSDCNLERGNLCLNAVLRDWFRVYVPKGSKLTANQGSEVKMKTYDELSKTVFEGFITVRPQGVAKLTLTYTLPFKLADNSVLPLMIQKQPGTNANGYLINTGGRKLEEFKLSADKTLNLNLK